MRVIRELTDDMYDELCGAKKYAKRALKYKGTNPELGELYHTLATTEYMHVNELHEQAVRLIRQVEESGRSYPAAMRRKWDSLHDNLIELQAETKGYLDTY